MPLPSEPSIVPPEPPSTPPETLVDDLEEQTTPKAPTVAPPRLNLPQNGNSSLMPPPSFTRPRLNNATSSTLSPSVSTLPPQQRPRQKVILAPGHSPLDWARLKSSGQDLRQTDTPFLLRIPPSELKRHRRRNDAWMAINGKVYNVTSYLPFHPGGEKEMMRGVGRDGTKVFMEFHAWVNPETMLDKCSVGFLVPEPQAEDSD